MKQFEEPRRFEGLEPEIGAKIDQEKAAAIRKGWGKEVVELAKKLGQLSQEILESYQEIYRRQPDKVTGRASSDEDVTAYTRAVERNDQLRRIADELLVKFEDVGLFTAARESRAGLERMERTAMGAKNKGKRRPA